MVNSTLRSLLGHLQAKKTNPALANAACSELYKRIKDRVILYAYYNCNRSSFTKGKGLEADIVQESLIVFFEKNKFDCNRYETEKILQQKLLSYIGRIITNKWIAKSKIIEKESQFIKIAEKNYYMQLKNKDVGVIQANKKIVNLKGKNIQIDTIEFSAFLHSLSPLEHDVILTYADYDLIHLENKEKLPRSEIKRLCETHGKTANYIRKIKGIVLEKLRKKYGLT